MPECEIGNDIPFNQPWLKNAIPSTNGKFDNCYRYAPKNLTTADPGKCSADMFDASRKIACTEFIHATDERNLQTEVKTKYDDFSNVIFNLRSKGQFSFTR